MTSRSTTCVKYLLAIYLVFFTLSGLCALGYTCYVLYSLHTYDKLADHARKPTLHLLGPLLFLQLTAYVGYRAIKNKHPMTLKTFAGMAVLTICWEVGGAMWCIVEKSHYPDVVPDVMKGSFDSAFNSLSAPGTSRSWDYMQKELLCCGINGPSDYKNLKHVPFSCCGSDTSETQSSCLFIYQKGCQEVFIEQIGHFLLMLMITVMSLSFMQVPAVLGACCLANRLSLEYDAVPGDVSTPSRNGYGQ